MYIIAEIRPAEKSQVTSGQVSSPTPLSNSTSLPSHDAGSKNSELTSAHETTLDELEDEVRTLRRTNANALDHIQYLTLQIKKLRPELNELNIIKKENEKLVGLLDAKNKLPPLHVSGPLGFILFFFSVFLFF